MNLFGKKNGERRTVKGRLGDPRAPDELCGRRSYDTFAHKEGFSIVHLHWTPARLHAAASLQLLTTCPLRTWLHGENKHSQGCDLKSVVRSRGGVGAWTRNASEASACDRLSRPPAKTFSLTHFIVEDHVPISAWESFAGTILIRLNSQLTS
jgi:hypothetical protein